MGSLASATKRLLIHGGEQTLNLFNQAALGDMLHPRIRQHGNIQQDAADFAGWFRAQLFDGRPDGQISTGWQKHLLHSTEDQGSVIAPLLLSQRESQKATLQELIDEWHQCAPYVCAFMQFNCLICVQIDRFPSLDCKFCEPIYWSRAEVMLPIFDDAHGFSVTWHDFHVLASVLHIGPVPQSGHYVSILYSPLSLLTTDDGIKPRQTFMNEDIARESYMLWLAPTNRLQNRRWRQPICRIGADPSHDAQYSTVTHLHALFGATFDV